jgi:hypothetical protein
MSASSLVRKKDAAGTQADYSCPKDAGKHRTSTMTYETEPCESARYNDRDTTNSGPVYEREPQTVAYRE